MLRYDKGTTCEIPDGFPAEFPFKLTLNGGEIAPLVASPHELHVLVAASLRTQGLIREIGDCLAVGVCDGSGKANARIHGELPAQLRMAHCERFSDVAGVILAGGESSRMGRNKALLKINGERMVEIAYRRMAELFDEVLLVTNTPETYDFIPCRKVADIYPGMGPLGGIHAALSNCTAGRAFITACDMPGLNSRLIRELSSMSGGVDVIIPETPGGLEPLHAVYAKSCLPKMEVVLRAEERRILSFFDLAQVRLVPRGRIATLDPDYASFRNVNTPEDYQSVVHAD